MPRRRFGVALLLPDPIGIEVYGLRKALGSPSLDRQPPHITLVPPVNVHVDDVDGALAVLRNGAEQMPGPLRLTLGPVASFAPLSPVLYLTVGGPDLASVITLRESVFVPPLYRYDAFDYVPHCTLHENVDDTRIAAGLTSLANYGAEITVRALTLLEDVGDRVWRSAADVMLGPAVVRGRGGVELHLRWCQHPAPDVRSLWAAADLGFGAGWWLEARDRDHALLGARNGDDVIVVDEHLSEGIEERLLNEPEPAY